MINQSLKIKVLLEVILTKHDIFASGKILGKIVN